MTRLLDWRSAPDITPVVEVLRQGGLAVVPTDTCYGVACDAFNSLAIDNLRRIRRMPSLTLLTVLVADEDVVEALVAGRSRQARAIGDAFWPGPLTILLSSQPSLRWDLGSPSDVVAIRIPQHDALRSLLREAGPLAVSQASCAGEPPPYSIDAALQSLGAAVDVAVEGGALPEVTSSTFVDCRDASIELLRAGPITVSRLLSIAGSEMSSETLVGSEASGEDAISDSTWNDPATS